MVTLFILRVQLTILLIMLFAVTSDVHLGVPNDTSIQRVFQSLVDTCITKQVDFLLLAGDIFDHARPANRLIGFFVSEMKRLTDHHITPVIIGGNHDTPKTSDTTLITSIIEQAGMGITFDNPFTFTEKTIQKTDRFNSVTSRISFLGKSFNHHNKTLTDQDLEIQPRDPDVDFRVGLLHCELDSTGPYEPVSTEQLENTDIDLWVLGHIHNQNKVIETKNNIILIPGALDRLSYSQETSDPGFYIVEWNKVQPEEIELEFIKTPAKKFHSVIQNVTTETDNIEQLVDAKLEIYRKRVSDDNTSTGRLVLTGKLSRSQFKQLDFDDLKTKGNSIFADFQIDITQLHIVENELIYSQGSFNFLQAYQLRLNQQISNVNSKSEAEFLHEVLETGLELLKTQFHQEMIDI